MVISMTDENCIFCKIANGEIPSTTLYEDEDFRVILDLGPATRGHALLLPKEHYQDLFALDDETASKVLVTAKKVAGEIPSKTLYEDEQFRVILDLGLATKGHALILPKSHYKNLYELPDATAADVMKLAKKMAAQMTEKLGCDGFNLVQNNNEVAGQTVFHFHMHLIPRYEGDNQHILWKPTEVTQDELEEIRKQITE